MNLLDKGTGRISHPGMNREPNTESRMGPRTPGRWTVSVCVAALSLATSGCLSPLAKHVKAFSDASDVVIAGSEDAYRTANDLRTEEEISAAVKAYSTNATWNPYDDPKPLLTPEQIQARIAVLDGLRAYAVSLTTLTGKRPDGLDTVAAGAGENLQKLNASVSTSLSNAIPGIPVMDSTRQNQVSTAIKALGEYLIARKVKGSLPAVTKEMNPHIATLCELLNSDVEILKRQADVDYKTLVTDQDMFIRTHLSSLSPEEQRTEIRALLKLAGKEKANDRMLSKLQASLHTLEMTHQALAAAAQGNDPASLQQNIAQLAAAGQDLNNYYKSLQAASSTN